MKTAIKITYVRLSTNSEPFAATIGGRMINRQPGEAAGDFKRRCEELLTMIKQG